MAAPDRTVTVSVISGPAREDAAIEIPGIVFFGRQPVYAPTTLPESTRLSRKHGIFLNAIIAVALILLIFIFFAVNGPRQIHTQRKSTQEAVQVTEEEDVAVDEWHAAPDEDHVAPKEVHVKHEGVTAEYVFEYDSGRNSMQSDRMRYDSYEETDASAAYTFAEMIEVAISSQTNIARLSFEIERGMCVIHDFYFNQTALVDFHGKRCFVMDLEYNITMTTKKFLHNIQFGNFSVQRSLWSMQITLPSIIINSMETFSLNIADQCANYNTYAIHKVSKQNQNGTEFKAAAERPRNEMNFAQFFGKGIVEYELLNIAEVVASEKLIAAIQKL